MTALLQLAKNAPDTHARIAAAVAECSKLGIEVLPPDVNASQENFSVERRPDGSMAIRFGLGVIKNVGAAAVEGIIAEREAHGPYRDIEDFCRRADLSSANSRALEHLAKAGAFDLLGGPPGPYNRATLAANAERLMALARRERELRASGQATMFDLFGAQVETPLPALDLDTLPQKREDLLAWEKELLGVYVSDHPFKSIAQEVARYATHSIADLGPELAGQSVTIAGMITRVQARATRDGRKFYLAEVEDLSGTAELMVWSDTIELTGEEAWAEGRVLVCSVEVRDRGERGVSYAVRKAAPYDAASGTAAGFAAAQWQVEVPKQRPAAPRPAGETQPPPAAPAGAANGRQQGGLRNAGPATEASRPGVTPPVEGEAVRLSITLIETDDVLADEALLKAVVDLLQKHPGNDEVRVVIRDTAGEEMEFDFPRAAATEELARSLRNLLGNRGSVRLTGGAKVAGAA
jgi:DNA polymerase-3 subunit alpha